MELTNEVTRNLVKYLAQKCPGSFYVQHSYYGGTEYPRDFLSKVEDRKKGYMNAKQIKDAAQELLKTVLDSVDQIERGSLEKDYTYEFAGTDHDSERVTFHELAFYLNEKKFWFFFGQNSSELENVKGYIRKKNKEVDFISLIEG